MENDLEERRENFEYWLFEMDDALEAFFSSLPPEVASRLDYSDESLDAIEHWILEHYASPRALLEPPEVMVLDGLARYVGETFRKQLGGHWEMRVDDPRYAYFGLPQLTGFSEKPTPECPHALVTASADRRTGTYFRWVLQNMKKRYIGK